MSSARKDNLERVRLMNVPHYKQGDWDGLCVYYSGAMMIAALYPKLESWFGWAESFSNGQYRIEDPLISNYVGTAKRGKSSSKSQKHRNILARWFYLGEDMINLVRTMNNVVEKEDFDTRFEVREETAHDNTFTEITRSIDDGLPVILSWDTEDFGCHAVVVVGYKLGQQRWFLLNDPGGSQQISWENLKGTKLSNFEVIECTNHLGPRPDKLTVLKDGTV